MGSQTDESAGFGAVAMQDIRLQPPDQVHEMRPHQNVRGMWFAMNGDTANAKLKVWGDLLKRRLGTLAAGETVGDDAYMVAAVGLSLGEIEDVADDTANRRADRMQDTKRLIRRLPHVQNQRSPTRTVSPGLTADIAAVA